MPAEATATVMLPPSRTKCCHRKVATEPRYVAAQLLPPNCCHRAALNLLRHKCCHPIVAPNCCHRAALNVATQLLPPNVATQLLPPSRAEYCHAIVVTQLLPPSRTKCCQRSVASHDATTTTTKAATAGRVAAAPRCPHSRCRSKVPSQSLQPPKRLHLVAASSSLPRRRRSVVGSSSLWLRRRFVVL